MQSPVKDYPVEFPGKGSPKLGGVVPYPVDANIDLCDGRLAFFGKIKGDNVRIVVVLKELTIDVQEVGIGTEDIPKLGQGFSLFFEEGDKKAFEAGSVRQGNGFEEIKVDDGIIHNFTGPCRIKSTKAASSGAHTKYMKRLSELEPGTVARIHSFEKNDLFLKLMEMGCVPGEWVRVEQVAPFGDPISITVAGYNLSLRLDEAENIFMEEGGR